MSSINLKKNILKYFLEMLIVAFGVFLGMFVAEWRAGQATKKNTAKSLNFIISELEENLESVAYAADYHQKVKIGLDSIRQDLTQEDILRPYFGNDVFHVMKIPNWTGIGITKYKTIAFEGAKINNVFHHLDIETVQLISGAYKQIEFNESFGKTIFDRFLASNSSTKTLDVIGLVELLTSDMVNSELVLTAELKTIVDRIKLYRDDLNAL